MYSSYLGIMYGKEERIEMVRITWSEDTVQGWCAFSLAGRISVVSSLSNKMIRI